MERDPKCEDRAAKLLVEMGNDAAFALCACLREVQTILDIDDGPSVPFLDCLRGPGNEDYLQLGWNVECRLLLIQGTAAGSGKRNKAAEEFLWACYHLFLATRSKGEDMRQTYRESVCEHAAKAVSAHTHQTFITAYARQAEILEHFHHTPAAGPRLRNSLLASRSV